MCLRCGSSRCRGVEDHVRADGGCTAKYSKQDLAAALCYVCGRRGHLCCKRQPAASYRWAAGSEGCSVQRWLRVHELLADLRLLQVLQLLPDPFGKLLGITVCRESCFNCGENGHTAASCSRNKPAAVRKEHTPGYDRQAASYSYYGLEDGNGRWDTMKAVVNFSIMLIVFRMAWRQLEGRGTSSIMRGILGSILADRK